MKSMEEMIGILYCHSQWTGLKLHLHHEKRKKKGKEREIKSMEEMMCMLYCHSQWTGLKLHLHHEKRKKKGKEREMKRQEKSTEEMILLAVDSIKLSIFITRREREIKRVQCSGATH